MTTSGVTLDWFYVVSGLITIGAFVFAIYVYLLDRGLKRQLENGLLALIGTLDRVAAMDELDEYEKAHLAIGAAAVRDHAIALLASFSDANKRLKTFDFGFDDEELEKLIEKRRRATGVGLPGGCILGGQKVCASPMPFLIEEVKVGDNVLSLDGSFEIAETVVNNVARGVADRFITIDEELSVTESQKILVRDKGWVSAARLRIGDEVYLDTNRWKAINNLNHGTGGFDIFAVETSVGNLFVNGILVHNKKME